MSTQTGIPADAGRSLNPDADPTAARPTRGGSTRWAWTGVAAGVLGVVATLVTNQSGTQTHVGPEILDQVSRGAYHVGGALGYVVVALLIVTAAAWRMRTDRSYVAARVVADGLTVSAAALALGYGWKLAMALYLPGGLNGNQFDTQAQFVYFVLNDFGAFIGWLGVVVSAGAMAWLSLRNRVVSVWLGIVSLVPVLAVLGMAEVLTVAGFPGVVGPIWMVIAFAGLALGRHRITAG